MADSKIQKTGGLLDQWKLLAEIISDKRTRKSHIQIAQIVIDRQKHEHGNGQASVRYLEQGTGLSKWRIGKATADLAEWGYVTRRPGVGTRPSEFTVVSWPSVRVQRDTNQPLLVSESGGTGCPSPEGHYEPLVSESGGTNPAYVNGLQAGLREAESSVGAATPPHAAGLAPASGETPPGRESVPDTPAGGFPELWDAFSLKLTNTKPKARAAYERLAPNAGLHASMVEAAARLHAHYEEHNTERRYRIQCHNWINASGWEDDLPIVYADAKSAAISKVRGKAKPADKPTPPAKTRQPAAPITARVTASEIVAIGGTKELRFTATDVNGVEHERAIVLEHDDMHRQSEGQKQFALLQRAAGLEEILDSGELHGRTIIITEDGFAAPTTRPDDEPPLPTRDEPQRQPPVSDESPHDFAARMAATLEGSTWPAWMDDEYEEDAA